VGKGVQYQAVYSDEAISFLMALPKRRQQYIANLGRQLAHNPFVESDYADLDGNGREIHNLLIEDYVFAYWLDHPVAEVRIVDIKNAT